MRAAALGALTLPLLPAWAAVTASHPRLRADLRGRWGLEVPPVQAGCWWVHAASVGEMEACRALVPHLDGPVLLTADTDTGRQRAEAIAAEHGPRVVAAVRPVDHPWTLAPLWADARPRAVVFVEGAWWPQLAERARAYGVPVARVSAKTGARTRTWAERLPWRTWTRAASLVVARDEGEAAWFREHVVARVVVGGDLKAAVPPRPSPLRWSRPFVVGCSTRDGDESRLLDAVVGAGLLLAPRHPDRFEVVAALLQERGARWCRRSSLSDGDVPMHVDVVLLDTLGELGACVQGAEAAFIGGSFDPGVGAHSPLDAARAGVATVAGPHGGANEAALERVGTVRVRDEELAEALAAARTRQVTPLRDDAGSRTAEHLGALVGGPAPEAMPRPWLAPVGAVFGAVAATRRRLDAARAVRVGAPVVSIGSSNARGPGKTSTVRWFADALAARGHRVGIATRGYGRPSRGIVLGQRWHEVGDEGALLAEAGHLVAAGVDRVAAARALIEAGATVVVLDDGLQQARLHRDVELVVLDARFPRARGLLPAGERRFPRAVPRGVQGVIAHHGEVEADVPVVAARRRAGPWHPRPPGQPVALFAGTGRPADVAATCPAEVARFRALQDHQAIDAALWEELLAWADGAPLACTAKDAVRLPAALRDQVAWWDVELELEGVPDAWLPVAPVG